MLKPASNNRRYRLCLMSATALTLYPAATAQAQQVSTPAEAVSEDVPAQQEQAEGPNDQADIVVTGTSRARAQLDTPLAVTTIDDDTLAKLTSSSQADILNQIPTVKAEGGGGEVAVNVFIKGLPSGGQYQFTPLQYDGIPVLSTFGLNSSAYDVYFRNDLGIARLEFVRGGVSNLFGSGSVAGLINYISKTGGETPEGTLQLEVANRTRVRADAALSGPVGQGTNLYYAVSGYYRYDEGPIRTGNITQGGQIRGNLKYEFGDGSGSVRLYGQYIDDQVQFYLPLPLSGDTRKRLPGNDGRKVEQVETDAVAGIGYNTPDGRFQTSITEGVFTRGGAVALVFDKQLGGGFGINGRFKWADYNHRFDFFLDGDGIVNRPETLSQFLRNRNLPQDATFTFVGGGPVPANTILFANRFIDRDRPAEDMSGELNLTSSFATGSFEHSVTLGGFAARTEARDFNVTTRYLGEFNNRPRLINLVVRNAAGNSTIISNNGLLDAGVGYVNNLHEAKRYAGYLADQIESGRFIFDIGARVEHLEGDILRERTATFVTDTTTPNLSAALRDVVWGNDTFLRARVDTTEYAAAVGALYKLTPDVSLYVNAARGYFFPELRAVTFNAQGQAQSYEGEIIRQVEGGLKFATGRFSGTVAALYTDLKNRRDVTFVNAPGGGIIERVNVVSTESYGVEAALNVRILPNLRFDGNVTLQDHKFTSFERNPAFVGNELPRQPNLLYNAGLYYDDRVFDAAIYTNYTGKNFTSEANNIELEDFHVTSLDVGYTAGGPEGALRLGLHIFNLFDSEGITEGSPRQDTSQVGGGSFFVGRPILPRRYHARLTYTF